MVVVDIGKVIVAVVEVASALISMLLIVGDGMAAAAGFVDLLSVEGLSSSRSSIDRNTAIVLVALPCRP